MLDTPRKLTVELIPQTAWGQNLRAILSRRDWDVLRRWCYQRAGYKCECCGGVGPKHPVECHEVWDWDEANQMQWLAGLVALCPTCHSVKHIGRTLVVSNDPYRTFDQLMRHIARTNGWDGGQTEDHFFQEQQLWQYRSSLKWHLNVSAWLTHSIHKGDFTLHDYTPIYANPIKENL